MSEGTLTGDHTQDSHHSTTIEIPGNGQINAAFEDTETNSSDTRIEDVANGIPVNQEETPSTPLAGHRDVNHHMNGTAASETKINGVVEPKSPTATNDVKDVAEAVNLELVSMQPFNNGIPVKKESTELDIGDPYDEYFVPVNQHKKYMRGEKLYVTQDKRRSLGGGKRKCCWGLLSVIVLGILVAILIGVLLTQDSNTPVKSRTFNSDVKGAGFGAGVVSTPPPKSTQQPPRPTTDISEMYLQRVIEGELTIDNMEFTPGLANQNTSEFITLATSLEEELKKALFDRQTLLYGSSDVTVKVLKFKSGSVIVLYRVGWQFKPGVHNSPDPLTKDNLKTRLQAHLKNNEGFLYNYRLPISSVKSSRIMDNCLVNNNNCSHVCHFNITELQFICSCPTDYILDTDRKTCIENNVEETDHNHITDDNFPMPLPSDDDQEPENSPESKASTENVQVAEHHTPIESEPEMEHSTEQETPHPHFHLEEPVDHSTSEPEPSPEPSHEPQPLPELTLKPEPPQESESSSVREELLVPSQESEPTPEPTYHEEISEHSVSSESSQEVQDHSPESTAELFSEHEHLPETTSNNEPMPSAPEEPKGTGKPESVIDPVSPADEISTEHELLLESDHSSTSSSETPPEDKPAPLTEYNSHETSEEPHMHHELEYIDELQTTEQPKPLTESQNAHNHLVDNKDSEHETKIISGSVPVAIPPVDNTTSTNDEPKQDTETFNQTEHGAGSMRSLNLEHSTDHIVQSNEMESNMSDHSHYISDMMNFSQSINGIEPEINTIMTTEMPTTHDHEVYTEGMSSMKLGSTDTSPSAENVEEHNTKSAGLNINQEHSHKVTSELETTTKESSIEKSLLKQMNTITESVDSTGKSTPKEPMTIGEFNSETTILPLDEEMTEMHDTSSSTSTEKQHSVLSTTELKLEMKNTDLPESEQVTETKLSFANNDTISPGMTSEFEFGITHVTEPVQDENETTINQVVTNVHYKHELMNGSEPVTVQEESLNTLNTEQIMKVSSKSETTTPYTNGEINKETSQITTQAADINLEETDPVHTTPFENLTTMKEIMTELKENEQLGSRSLNTESSVQVNTEEHTTMIVTTSEHMIEKVHENMTENEQIFGAISAEIATTIKPKTTESNQNVTTTVKSTTQSLDDSDMTTIFQSKNSSYPDLNNNVGNTEKDHDHLESVTEPVLAEIAVTTEMTSSSNESVNSNTNMPGNEKVPSNLVTESKPEITTLTTELSDIKYTNNMTNTNEMIPGPIVNQESNLTTTEQSPSPLHTPDSSPHMDDMPMISITSIPDLLGPYSVDTIIDPPSSYTNDDVNNREHLEDNHSADITADTLNSLDDDYNEDDKKKYYRPAKSKNYKNFKIQEVNIPLDSLADETTKDIQHSKDSPGDISEVDITTMPPSIIKDQLNSNEAFTTKSPLFHESPKKTSTTPTNLPQDKDEHLNGLFFSNEAETTKSPIFDNTGDSQNKTQEQIYEKDHVEDGLNHLEAKVENEKEPVTETIMIPNEDIIQNSTMDKSNDATNSTLHQLNSNNSSDLNMTTEHAGTTIKPENDTDSGTMKLMDSTLKPLNSSGLIELLNPSKKCATGQFACADGNGCIKAIERCDAVKDCGDGSDEMNCEEQGCLGNFQCKSGECLRRSLVCDSSAHCSDGSDESDCENWKCNFDELRCPHSGQCIPVLWKCDGKSDCKNNEDEFECRESCANDEFFCPEGRCIPHNSTCNGKNDCLKGEDETHCSST